MNWGRLFLMMTAPLLVGLLITTCSVSAQETKDDGWEVLFDGTSTDAFRGWKMDTFPEKGWVIDGDALHIQADSKAGDIVTKKQYESFDLRFEWKVAKGSNSGVIYRCIEHDDVRLSFMSGPEYQILEDANHRNGKNPKTTAASLYAHYAPNDKKTLKPIGEWNTGRVVINGSKVEHWLNGEVVVAYDLESEAFKKISQGTHYKQWSKFAKEKKGHIAFQDHTDDVWFRNIKIKELPNPEPVPKTEKQLDAGNWRTLFDGKSLDHFRSFKNDSPPERWVIQDDTLHYTGGKFGGDLLTKKAFGDFDLRWEWKISEGGNSGIKYRVDGNNPNKGIYAWGLEYQILDDGKHNNGKNPTMRAGSLYSLIAAKDDKPIKPVGEWNQSRVVLKDNKVQHYLNGEVIVEYEIGSEAYEQLIAKSKYKSNKNFGKTNPGHIAFQDHEDLVWYRNIRIRELDSKID
ncbi:MAG: DUF1080 domain-containing protein [Phycisphaeraceae bacterium]